MTSADPQCDQSEPSREPSRQPSREASREASRELSRELASEAAEAKLRVVHERLTHAIAELTSAENWQLMLRTAAKLPTYSPHNVLLITTQCPHASAVAGFHTWKQLGRSVRKGEKGLAILAPVLRRQASPEAPQQAVGERAVGSPGPDATDACGSTDPGKRRVAGFRVVHVFDISQTDGPDLPEPPRPELLEGQAPDGLLQGLTEQITNQGFQLLRHDFDIPHPGVGVPNGVTDYFARTVIVRPDLSDAQTAKTLAHELGHVLLHEPTRRPADLTRQRAEVEAESVAHIVADAHGLDTGAYTVPYVAGWSEGNLELLARSAERVIATSHQILRHTPPTTATLSTGDARPAELTRDSSRTIELSAPPAPERQPVARSQDGPTSRQDAVADEAPGDVAPLRPAPPPALNGEPRRRDGRRATDRSTARDRTSRQGRLW